MFARRFLMTAARAAERVRMLTHAKGELLCHRNRIETDINTRIKERNTFLDIKEDHFLNYSDDSGIVVSYLHDLGYGITWDNGIIKRISW